MDTQGNVCQIAQVLFCTKLFYSGKIVNFFTTKYIIYNATQLSCSNVSCAVCGYRYMPLMKGVFR